MKPETFHALNARVKRMAELYTELNRKSRHFTNGLSLFSSELHLLEMIGRQPGLSVTALAQWLGVTKGAVSQTLRRLSEKGLVQRETDPENLSRMKITLSDRGREIFLEHVAWHEGRLDGGLLDFMNELSEEEGLFLQRTFDRFNQILQRIHDLNP